MDSLLALQHYADDDDDSDQPSQPQPLQSHPRNSLLPPPKRARKERKRTRTVSAATTAGASAAPSPRLQLPTPDFTASAATTVASARAPGLRLRSDNYSTSSPAAAASAAVSLPAPVAAASAAHGGRIRSFPHVDGAWAAHIFLPLTFPACSVCAQRDSETDCPRSQAAFERRASQAEQEATCEMAKQDAAADECKESHKDASSPVAWTKYTISIPLGPPEESMVTRPAASASSSSSSSAASTSAAAGSSASSLVHVSLSRTFVLRYDQISDFVGVVRSALREVLEATPPLRLIFRESKLYWNEEHTRAFAAMRVWPITPSDVEEKPDTALASKSAGPAGACPGLDWTAAASAHATVLELISRIDAALADFGLQGYYQPPEPHATVAWTLPAKRTKRANLASSSSASSVPPEAATAISLPEAHACMAVCDRVHLSIGNRLYTLPFQLQAHHKQASAAS